MPIRISFGAGPRATDAEVRRLAYEESLRRHRKSVALAYKLTGGRLNEPPKRKLPKLPNP